MRDSLHVRESKTVLNSGFHVVDSGFQVLNSGLLINGKQWLTGLRSPWAELRIPGPGFRIPHVKMFKSSESRFPYIPGKIRGKRIIYSFVYLRLLHNNWATGWLTLIAFYSIRGLSISFFLKNAALGLKSNPTLTRTRTRTRNRTLTLTWTQTRTRTRTPARTIKKHSAFKKKR